MRTAPLGVLLSGAVEGGFANCYNPRTQVLAGPGGLRAGVGTLLPSPGGCIVGRCAFVNAGTGLAYNAQADAIDGSNPVPILGFVIPCPMPDVSNSWQRTYWQLMPDGVTRVRVIRPGLELTLCKRGDFFGRFADGAYPGLPVYADPLDGHLIAGFVSGAILTPWSVITPARPEGLAVISTWSNFT